MSEKIERLSDESAFPIFFPCDPEGHISWGMTLREYYAGKAMQGYLANPDYAKSHPDKIAQWSVENADALLKALSK